MGGVYPIESPVRPTFARPAGSPPVTVTTGRDSHAQVDHRRSHTRRSGAAAAPASAESLTVTSPLDNGSPGTLRRAILKSNASTGVVDTIRFSLAASAPHTITPQSNLPTITDPVEIDGGAEPTVSLDASNTTRALALATNGSVVRGLHIMESSAAGTADGIRVTGDGNRIETSYLGTDRSGSSTQNWNLAVGVAIAGDGNVVSGSVIAEIDGNGIVAVGDENRVEGNRVGLDLDPGSQLGNCASTA